MISRWQEVLHIGDRRASMCKRKHGLKRNPMPCVPSVHQTGGRNFKVRREEYWESSIFVNTVTFSQKLLDSRYFPGRPWRVRLYAGSVFRNRTVEPFYHVNGNLSRAPSRGIRRDYPTTSATGDRRVRSADPPKSGNAYLDRTDWWEAVGLLPVPRIAVIQDLDAASSGASTIGEVHAAILKAFHCDGVITNGSVRDIPGVSGCSSRCSLRLSPYPTPTCTSSISGRRWKSSDCAFDRATCCTLTFTEWSRFPSTSQCAFPKWHPDTRERAGDYRPLPVA
jgi:hypothetical protein